MNALATTNNQAVLNAIDNSTAAPNSRYRYKRIIQRAIIANVDFMSADSVAAFAETLPASTRSQLKAALRIWYRSLEHEINANATPDTANAAVAAKMRLEALQATIKTQAAKGTRAHSWLSKREVKALFGVCSDTRNVSKRDAALLALIYGCGLRRDEASRAKWSDLIKQGDSYTLGVLGKGAKSRAIPVNAQMYDILTDWKRISGANDTDAILQGVNKSDRITGAGISGQSIYKIVGQLGANVGLDIQPHDLRRTFAQTLRTANVPLETISALLGHSSIETTKKYLEVKTANADMSALAV